MSEKPSLTGIMRLRFVILTPACVLLGMATAYWESGSINWLNFILALIGAISAHISVNAFNEYFDFKSGLDSKTERTPFSGGTGTLQALPNLVKSALFTAWMSLIITTLIGVFFLIDIGIALLPLGALGLLIIYIYTKILTKNPFLCLVAPGLGFGTLMVIGTHFAMTGEYSWTAFIASLIPFFLVSNLLLLNQFPDVEADKTVGRKHFPITIGKRKSSYIYISFLILPYIAIGYGVYSGLLPAFSLLGLITILLAIPIIKVVSQHSEDTEKLLPALTQNVAINILTPLLTAIGIFIG